MKKFISVMLITILVVATTVVSFAATTFYQNFSKSDSGDFPSGWTRSSGSWEINKWGRLAETSGTSTAILYRDDIDAEDQTVEAIVKPANYSYDAGIIAKYVNDSNYYTLFLDNNKVKLKKKVNGKWTTLGSKSVTYSTSSYTTLKLVIDGSSLKAYVNGVLKISVTDSSITSGSPGFRTYKNKAKFDTFTCTYDKSNSSSSSSYPSDILDLTNWKLTIPYDGSDSDSNADEIEQPELDTYYNSNYFYVNDDSDGVVFMANCGGATTSGSSYPRSELREMENDGEDLASWSTTSGTHTMEITQKITHLPEEKDHVVVGQIHDADDDVIVFRLEGSKLFIDENGEDGPTLTSNYELGTVFTVKFVVKNGGVKCYYNDEYIYTYEVETSGCYFKAGVYTQSNTSKGDDADAYGENIIYDLSVSHS
jgi:poly(beta-D-mannuronate) lyase